MNSRDHEKVKTEDYQTFERLLIDYYGEPYPAGHARLKRKIEARLLGKDTNSLYRPVLINDLEDLSQTVVLRLVAVNSRSLREKGEGIRDVELMAGRVADNVYREELRAIRRGLKEQPIDHYDPENKVPPVPQPTGDEVRAIVREIIRECYDACVDGLPAADKDLFRAYYPKAELTPAELAAARKRLAREAAGMTPAQSQEQTPEQEARTLNNLQSRVNKCRKNRVEACVKDCAEARKSRHPRLNYLSEQ